MHIDSITSSTSILLQRILFFGTDKGIYAVHRCGGTCFVCDEEATNQDALCIVPTLHRPPITQTYLLGCMVLG